MRIYLLCLIFYLCFSANLLTVQAQTCNDHMVASTPDSQLKDNKNGTITDSRTGLMWKQCLEGYTGSTCKRDIDLVVPTSFQWKTALQLPVVVNNGSGFAGYHDWRLPNFKELRSIVEEKCCNPAINLTRFPGDSWGLVWSESPRTSGMSAWVVDFAYGNSRSAVIYLYMSVRLVRGGQ